MVNLKAAVFSIFPVAVFLAVWEALSLMGLFNPQFIPSPVSVGRELINSFAHENLLGDVFSSLGRVVIGFLIAAVLGIGLGLFVGANRKAKNFVMPLMELFRPVPPIAWIPIAILWFGLGDKPAYFLVFTAAFFPLFTNAVFGAINLEETYKRAAYSLGAQKKYLFTDVLIPASLPHIFAGMKIGLGVSWMAVITAEMVGAQSGLGYMIQFNRLLLDTPKLVVGMVVIGVIGFSLNKLMVRAEHALAPWKNLQ